SDGTVRAWLLRRPRFDEKRIDDSRGSYRAHDRRPLNFSGFTQAPLLLNVSSARPPATAKRASTKYAMFGCDLGAAPKRRSLHTRAQKRSADIGRRRRSLTYIVGQFSSENYDRKRSNVDCVVVM